MTANRAWPLLLVALVAVVACGSPRRSEPLGGRVEPVSAEVTRGERVFMAHCHQCHPSAEGGLGPPINDKLPGFLIRTQVRAGVGAMPAFSSDEIPAADLDAVLAYLRAPRSRAASTR